MSRFRLVTIVAVVGLAFTTFVAASAFASGWRVGGASLSGSAALANTAEILPSKLEAESVEAGFECEGTTEIAKGEIKAPNGGEVESLKLNNCQGTHAECCLEGTTVGTLPLKVTEVTLDNSLGDSSGARGRFVPKTGTQIATVKFDGEACSLAGKQPIKGSVDFLAWLGQHESRFQLLRIYALPKSLEIGSDTATLEIHVVNLSLASGTNFSFE